MQIPVGFAQVTHVFAGAGLDYGAVVTYGVENEIPQFVESVAQNAHDAFEVRILPRLPNEVQLTQTIAKLGPNSTGAQAVYNETDAGGTAGSVASSNVTWLVRKNTGLGGRQGRGRMYLPGVRESEVGSDGTIASADVTAWNTALASFLADLSGFGIPMVLLHNDALAPTPVTSLVLDSKVATQRRRLRR